jgi:hypothetical protein
MNAPLETDWLAQNQQALSASLERLRQRLARLAAGEAADEDAEETPTPPTLDRLCKAFDLSPFERDILLLAAGRELSAGFATTLGAVNGGWPYPTFGLALAALRHAHWSALSPGAPLRAWQLIECVGDTGLTQRELRLDEQILHWLAGIVTPDQRLAGLVTPARAAPALAPSHAELAQRIARAISAASNHRLPLIELVGADGETTLAIAATVAAALDQPLVTLAAASVPASPQDRRELVLRLRRARVLMGDALYIRPDGKEAESLVELLEDSPGPVFVAWPDSARPLHARAWRFVVEPARDEEQRLLVEEALAQADVATVTNDLMPKLALAPRMVDRLARALRSGVGSVPGDSLLEACRRETGARLERLAQRIEPRASWDDLVVPAETRRLLATIASQVRHRAQVYDQWGFAAKSARGLGISALFDGSSGTGKTMAAEVLARDLGLDLYHIDLSGVVSKYIGETEKNLARLFDAAEGSGTILFFDEADALFGKRSEVRDSHDRYANIEVSYLLQRMESYRGLAILTTNLKSALDTAFLRRIRFVVPFPFPDAASRAEIWRRVFPSDTPTEGLKPEQLAQLNVPGGHIRNIALAAAFFAAERGERVTLHHVLEGARLEYRKLEKPLADAETRGWAGVRR